MPTKITPHKAKHMYEYFQNNQSHSISFGHAAFWAFALHAKDGIVPKTFKEVPLMNPVTVEIQCITPQTTLLCMLENGIVYYENISRDTFLDNTGLTEDHADQVIQHLHKNIETIAPPSAVQTISNFLATTIALSPSGGFRNDASRAMRHLTNTR